MACLKASMSFLNLLDLSGKAKPKKHRVYVNPVYDEKRDSYVEGLYNTWEQVSTREDPYLNAASFTTSGIKCHNLLKESSFDEAPNGPKFFREMPHGKLQEYKVITDDKDTMRDLCVEKKLWLSKEENLCNELHPLGLAETICNALQLAFDTHRRMTSDGQKVTLMQTTGWKRANFADGVFHSAFHDDVFHSKHWYPQYAWQSGKPKNQPHVMFTTAHEYEGNDNSLLRGEVLAIMAVMMTRFGSGSFDQHNIIPVMVLSFMPGRKGRVLQAYFADDGLVIYKSRLFSFEGVRDGRISSEFFLEYMGSEMIGDTAVTKTLSIVNDSISVNPDDDCKINYG